MFQLIFFTGTPSGTPLAPMNTRFLILFQMFHHFIYKRYNKENKMIIYK